MFIKPLLFIHKPTDRSLCHIYIITKPVLAILLEFGFLEFGLTKLHKFIFPKQLFIKKYSIWIMRPSSVISILQVFGSTLVLGVSYWGCGGTLLTVYMPCNWTRISIDWTHNDTDWCNYWSPASSPRYTIIYLYIKVYLVII